MAAMAASVASVGCKVTAALASSAKVEKIQAVRSVSMSNAFGLKPAVARVSCNLEENVKSIVDNAKAAAIVLASSALVAGVNSETQLNVAFLIRIKFQTSRHDVLWLPITVESDRL